MKNQLSPIILNKKAHNNSIESAAVHPNFKTLATGSHDHSIKLWDVQTFKETSTLVQHK
jgi:WD40 repeat protein